MDDVGNTLVSLNLRHKGLSNPIGGTDSEDSEDSEPVVKVLRLRLTESPTANDNYTHTI